MMPWCRLGEASPIPQAIGRIKNPCPIYGKQGRWKLSKQYGRRISGNGVYAFSCFHISFSKRWASFSLFQCRRSCKTDKNIHPPTYSQLTAACSFDRIRKESRKGVSPSCSLQLSSCFHIPALTFCLSDSRDLVCGVEPEHRFPFMNGIHSDYWTAISMRPGTSHRYLSLPPSLILFLLLLHLRSK